MRNIYKIGLKTEQFSLGVFIVSHGMITLRNCPLNKTANFTSNLIILQNVLNINPFTFFSKENSAIKQ